MSIVAKLDKMKACWSGSGNIAVRFGIVVSLFFEGGATTAKRLAAVDVLRDYLTRFGDKITHYQKLGASRLSRIKSLDFLDTYAAGARDMASDEGIDYAVYGFEDGIETDDPVFWYAGVTAMGPFELAPADTSSLDIYLPASWLAHEGPDRLIELVTSWANRLQAAHGTAGFGTLFNPGARSQAASLVAFPFLKRFPGLDYNDSISWSSARGENTRQVIRTTNWLNIVSAAYLDELGGRTEVARGLSKSCRVIDLQDGTIIVAGPQPQLFDNNRGLPFDDFQAVARVLKPLRFENYRRYGSLFAAVPDPLDPVAESLRWVRRFD